MDTVSMTATADTGESPIEKSPANPVRGMNARGEQEAFVDANYEQLYRWFWWLTRCREEAADLTQDTFAAYWASLERTTPHQPRVWLYRIARNRWRNHLRDRREEAPLTVVRDATSVDPSDTVSNDEQVKQMCAAMDALSPTYRDAIALRMGCELDYRDIARVLGIPASLVRWRVHRAQLQLRQRLGAATSTTRGEQ